MPRSPTSPPIDLFAGPIPESGPSADPANTSNNATASGSGSQATYASVLRRARDRHWTTEDVDRNEGLDELNPFNPSSSDQPPWRWSGGRIDFGTDQETEYIPLNTESSESGPRLSLDDLLGGVRAERSEGPSVITRRYQPRISVRAEESRRRPIESTSPRDSWAGAIDSARRQGYSSSSRPAWRSRQLEAFLSGESDLQAIGGHVTSDDSDEGSGPSTRSIFRMENRTTDDLRVLGGSGGAVTLNRGTNNRRRRSLIERLANQIRLDEEERQRSAPPTPRRRVHDPAPSLNGHKPTNEALVERYSPLVVRSTESLKHALDDESPRRKVKRRKVERKPDPEPERPTRPTYLEYTTLDPSAILPMEFVPPTDASHVRLEVRTRHQRLGPQPIISFAYVSTMRGERNPDSNASALRTSEPIPTACGVHYFEAEVVDAGEEGHMSVGWLLEDVQLGRLVGWEKGSWGWHGDDGKTFEGRGQGQDFSEKWSTGDVVGCGIDFIQKRAFFTKNGELLGYRFKNLGTGLRPAVGLKTFRETVAVNFLGPFKYDIDAHVRELRDQIWKEARSTKTEKVPRLVDQIPPPPPVVPVSSSSQESTTATVAEKFKPFSGLDINEKTSAALVLDYLSFAGLTSTLLATEKEMDRRKWIQRDSIDSSLSRSTPALDSDPVFSDFASDSAAIEWLSRRLATLPKRPVPWTLMNELWTYNMPKWMERQLRIYDFSVLIDELLRYKWHRMSPLPETMGDVDELDDSDEDEHRAIELGRDLGRRCKVEKWSEELAKTLEKAFVFLISSRSPESAEKAKDGSEDIWRDHLFQPSWPEIIDQLRLSRDLKPRSHLHQAIAQTSVVARVLAANDPQATFVDVRRVLQEGDDKMIGREIKQEPVE